MAEEILMKMVVGHNAVEGESIITFDVNDDLMDGFQRGKILELKSFDFDLSVEDNDEGNEVTDKSILRRRKSKTPFRRWLGGQRDLKKDGYPIDLKAFEFSRQFDKASPMLFERTANSQSFTSATVVKRKMIGVPGKTISSHGFMRFDFSDVLLTSLKWDIEDEVVMEKGQFICRKVFLQYRPQLANGSLGDIIPGMWEYPSSKDT